MTIPTRSVHCLAPRRRRERLFAAALLFPCFAFVAVFAFYPIIHSLYLSLYRIILGLPGLSQPFVYLENYRQLWGDAVARHALANTFLFVAVSTTCEMLLGLAMALVINRSFRGRGLIRAAVLIPWAIPTVVASQMWRFINNDHYGLLNFLLYGSDLASYQAWLADPTFAMAAVVVADIWKTSAFAALIILAGLQTIPDELYEAARLDGATAWQRFTRITLPLIKPALLIALLFRTMDAFRVFDLVFVMTQGGPADATNVLQFYGYKKMFAEGLLGYGATISVLVFLIILALSLVYVRFLGREIMEERP
ncbi:MAG TPA: sugar ABC transporter permease [Syntrophales bacterium]|nr:sugar ABC transporter permease [Syntrophales bacterium]HPN08250.1 sugar ABC transporter permease [Syntrophales bacterium]HPX81179.1 sugar ABC transporter permease [Syntrophales bacterium]HQK79153.1 sugar ABC transporter permease [Syntrophales bacterium]